MRIAAIDLPLRLVEARRSGQLVIFVGAGVSRPAPSSLPDFKGLVTEVAEGALEPKEGEPSDHFLGRLAQHGIHVHERATRILSRPDSIANELHHLLVEIFLRPEDLRIVTTNFDRHFEPVIAARWPSASIDIYSAPALPVGSRVSGLVYVHGILGKYPHDMVLTDGDFGRAYLTEGWARRFLKDVFTSYDVLFVGYSHQDIVLSYLARGLPVTSNKVRFALTGDGDPEHWRFLGITPIEYDSADNHAALLETLRGWRDLEGRGALSHEREVQQLVARPAQALTEQEHDYLLFCLSDPRLAQFFYRHAHDPTWLTWAAERSILLPLFSYTEDFNTGAEAAEWFAREPLSARGEVSRGIAQKARHLSWRLWSAIAHSIWQALEGNVPCEAAQCAAQWLTILERHDNASFGDEIIAYWLRHLSAEGHTFLALQLFEYLTRPVGLAEHGIRSREDGSLEGALLPTVKIRGDRHWLQEAWATLFSPNLGLFARHLVPLTFAHLQQAHVLLRSQGVASDGWDPLAYSRPAIEVHEQNAQGLHEAFGVLIDAAREALDWLVCENPVLARHYIEVGLSIEAPLVRRLCIHSLGRHPDVSANAKIAAVVERGWLGQWLLRHETFQLLRGSYKESGPTLRRRLLRAAEGTIIGPQQAADGDAEDTLMERQHFELFTLLKWLEATDPSCQQVKAALRRIQRRYPDFPVREHSDFGHWSHGVQTVQTVSPVPLDTLLRLEAIDWIGEYTKVMMAKRDVLAFDDPLQGFLLETEKAVVQDFNWGFRLLQALAALEMWDHSVWHYVLRSWARQAVTEFQWNSLLSFIRQHEELFRHASDVADVLLRRLENRESVATGAMVAQAFSLAEALWEAVGPDDTNDDQPINDWVQYGIDRAGGKLGLFAVHALSRLRAIQEDEWKGIPDQMRPLLEKMADAGADSSPLGRVMLCSQLHFFFGIDAEWTRNTLFPLFDWSRERHVAVQAWHGFLIWGRATRPLLADFMPYVIQTFDYLADLTGQRQRFSELLAWMAYTSESNPVDAGWIREYLRKSAPEDRKKWASSIGSVLDSIDEAQRRGVWEAWLRKYIELRLNSEAQIGDDEWRAVTRWSLRLGDVLPEIVALLVKHPAKSDPRDIFYYRLREQGDLLRHPEALADLLYYLLAAEERIYHHCRYVEEIVEALIDTDVSRAKLLSLAERLGELGCADAQRLAARIYPKV